MDTFGFFMDTFGFIFELNGKASIQTINFYLETFAVLYHFNIQVKLQMLNAEKIFWDCGNKYMCMPEYTWTCIYVLIHRAHLYMQMTVRMYMHSNA